MFFNVAASKAAVIVKALAITLLCATVLLYSAECADGAVNGLTFCLNVLVPSLFPFMAIASFIVNSSIAQTIGKPFGKIIRAVFGLNDSFAPVILLSMIGGYPVGAQAVASLYKNNLANRAECEKAALFAVCAGPGFLVNFVGISLYNSKTIGLILLFSQMLSVILIGILIRFAYRRKSGNTFDRAVKFKTMPLSNTIVQSAFDSSKGMLMICSFVVLFSAFTGIINSFLSDSDTKDFILIFLEVCSAVNEVSADKPIELIAFAAGFGGLCVHFQIYSALGEVKVSKLLFFCTRIIQGTVTALLTHFGLIMFTDKQQVFSTAAVQSADFFGGTVISGVVLLGISICFLYTIKNFKQN